MIRALDRATAFRLGRTFGAQAYGQVVTIAVQIALVPLLLRAWGTDVYGAWLLLAAVPFALTFSDFGFTFVAKNAMVMAVAAGRRDAALVTFQSIFALLSIALPLLLAMSIAAVVAVDLDRLLAVRAVSAGTLRIALLLLVANVLGYQLFLLVCAGIRAENRPASEAGWAASARLGEGLAMALAVIVGGGIVAAAAAMAASRLLFLIAAYRWLRHRSDWLRFGRERASRAELRRLASPALAYMALPIGHAMLLQGPLLIVGGVMGAMNGATSGGVSGAGAVVTFATSRTLARLGVAGANMIANSVASEYSALSGAGDREGFARLRRAQAGITALAVLGYVASVSLAAPLVLPLLTHGAVTAVQPFFLIVVLGVAAEMIWAAVFTPVAAVNRHRGVTLGFVIVAGGALAALGPLVATFGLVGAAAALLAAHLAMIGLCLAAVRRG